MGQAALAVTADYKCAGRSFLSGDTESTAGSAGRLGLLTSDLEIPEVSQTSVSSDLLQSFQIFSELGVNTVGDELGPGSIAYISLSVKEPLGDVVVSGRGEDVVDLLNVGLNELSSALAEIDLGDLEDEGGEAAADTLDGADGESSFALAVDVGVLHTENVGEVLRLNEME